MKDAHLHFRIGNVIEAPGGGLWIVTDVRDDKLSAVSFDHEAVSAVQSLDDYTRSQMCDVCRDWSGPSGCDQCDGSGYVAVKVMGWRHAKLRATNVRAFILKGLKRQFRL